MTSWLTIGAIAIVALFCVNAIAYRVRHGTRSHGRFRGLGMREPSAWLVYGAWCWAIATAISAGPKVIKLFR